MKGEHYEFAWSYNSVDVLEHMENTPDLVIVKVNAMERKSSIEFTGAYGFLTQK